MKIKKFIAEFIGTAVLVFFGCGTAVVGTYLSGAMNDKSIGTVAIALAFGLSLTAMCYAIGKVSGCHVNPAVSLAVLINGKMSVSEFFGYVISQCAGSFAGCLLLSIVNKSLDIGGYGANGYGNLSSLNISLSGAIVVEIVLTFTFVLTVLGATTSKKYSGAAGVVVGAALTLVHIIGIPLTGTSVNPARSLMPALFTRGEALSQVWVFILAPLAGAAIAGVVFKLISDSKDTD